MIRFPRPWTKRRGGRTLSTTASSLVSETIAYASALMVGVFGLTLILTYQYAPGYAPSQLPDAPPLRTPVVVWIFGALFLAAIAVGGGRLGYRLFREAASHEYRSVLAGRAGKMQRDAMLWMESRQSDLPVSARQHQPTLAGVPAVDSQMESPGEQLRYRLASGNRMSGWLGIAVLAFSWNVVWFILLGIAVSGILQGVIRPFLMFLLIPLGWIGLCSFRALLNRLRRTAGVGPTIVEISDHPLHPGQKYELLVAQWGRVKLSRLTVELVCEEESFYRQGTDIRQESHDAFRLELHRGRSLQVDPHDGWRQQLNFSLADDAMHSLVGSHNAIRWKIVVRGESHPCLSFCRSFPVVVYPPLPPQIRNQQ